MLELKIVLHISARISELAILISLPLLLLSGCEDIQSGVKEKLSSLNVQVEGKAHEMVMKKLEDQLILAQEELLENQKARISIYKKIVDESSAELVLEDITKTYRRDLVLNEQYRKAAIALTQYNKIQKLKPKARTAAPRIDVADIMRLKKEEAKERHRLRNNVTLTNFERDIQKRLLSESIVLPTYQRSNSSSSFNSNEHLAQIDKLLSSWHGNREVLNEAKKKIDELLSATVDPIALSQAWKEFSRWKMMTGYRVNMVYEREAVNIAKKAIDKALLLNPKNDHAMVYLAYIYLTDRRIDEAREQLNRAKALGSTDPWLAYNRALAHNLMSEHEKEKIVLETLIKDLKENDFVKASALEKLASVYIDEHRFDAAEKAFIKLVKINADNRWHWGNYGGLLLYQVGDLPKAIEKLEHAISLGSYGVARQSLAMAYYAQWALESESHPEAAQIAFDNAFATNGDLDHILVNSSRLLNPELSIPLIQKLQNEKGVSLTAKNDKGRSLLNMAIENHNSTLVGWITEQGFPLDLQRGEVYSPLTLAAYKNFKDIVAILVAAGADVNETSSGAGMFPLSAAAGFGSVDILKLLIESGASVNLISSEGSTALKFAAKMGKAENMKLLLKAGAKMEGLIDGIYTWKDVGEHHGPHIMSIIEEYSSDRLNEG